REVGFPRRRQHEHRTSLLDGDLRLQSHRGGERGKRGHGRRRAGHGMEAPDRPRGRARLQQRRPCLLLTAANGDQVEIVGGLDAAEDPKGARVGLVEGQESDESVGIAHAPDLDTVIGGEGLRPLALPDPGEEWRAQRRSGVKRAPRGFADRVEAVEDVDLHRSPSEESVAEPDVASSPSPPLSSAIASSTASLKSSPRSSPISWPMRFMKRPTLAGSFSSRSPSDEGSASDSRRASSDFTVAKRDMTRLSAEPPQRGHVGAAATDGRRISMLTTRRQSRQSYS